MEIRQSGNRLNDNEMGEHPNGVPAAVGTIDVRLQGGPEAASHARRAISRLGTDIDEPLMETMRLLVTELVSNSVKHAASETVGLKVAVARSAVVVEVTDQGSGFKPRPRPSNSRDESGWGLFLVERLAHRWGVGREGPATRVWFELRRTH
jgi:anti-sigma regulatory factor (Ser/Thr protein kinase)